MNNLVTTLVVSSLSYSYALASASGTPRETIVTQFIRGAIDLKNNSVTLPLHHGSLTDGRSVWYVLTDSSDRTTSDRLGIGYSPALSQAANLKGTQSATYDAKGELIFSGGGVDFSPVHSITPGKAPALFPPIFVQPGSTSANDYSPLIRVTQKDGTVVVFDAPMIAFNVNASQISFCSGNVDYSLVHDHVVNICPATLQVTLSVARGYAQGRSLVYLTFDANVPLAATLEADTLATSLDALLGTGVILPLYAVTNGQTGVNNPNRQGFDSALSGDGAPLNVLASFPTLTGGYSPIWDIQGVSWTSQAIADSKTRALKSARDVFTAYAEGELTGLAGGRIQTLGILVNCPALAIIQ